MTIAKTYLQRILKGGMSKTATFCVVCGMNSTIPTRVWTLHRKVVVSSQSNHWNEKNSPFRDLIPMIPTVSFGANVG